MERRLNCGMFSTCFSFEDCCSSTSPRVLLSSFLIWQTYTHFNPGEPNSGTSENCVNMYFDDGTWADVPCSQNGYTSGFICQVVIAAARAGPTWVQFPNSQPAYQSGPYTWDGAVAMCTSLGATLCSYNDLCGGDQGGDFAGVSGVHPGHGDNWTPYIDQQYHWTNTGDSRSCMQEGGDISSWHGMSHCCEDADDTICCDFGGGGH